MFEKFRMYFYRLELNRYQKKERKEVFLSFLTRVPNLERDFRERAIKTTANLTFLKDLQFEINELKNDISLLKRKIYKIAEK